ncbi:MAG: bifunctional (p)ppGpp synthetase/guanosine-3',5'-bis(diphosphate) 3'-pyrophosphohydrolase [SAR324 cluster bacterium]|nr:bifunctional (p)ppGpp synthetase/guanosine-3',5'-bis(diphosphate) 3'-pyrophosphohydrolase [SAR324 cluster bacterium]
MSVSDQNDMSVLDIKANITEEEIPADYAVWMVHELKHNIRVYVSCNSSDEERQLLEYAMEDIEHYHGGQLRKSGDPVIIHPLRVAWAICRAGLDAPTVISSLLHDIIEDTEITREDITKRYGEWYAYIVDGLTKIKYSKDSHGKQSSNLEATYQKILITAVKDVRALLIKLFDRLDNMRDLSFLSRAKQRRISRETMNIYVPMARRLGLEELSREHTELAFSYLYPRRYRQVLRDIDDLMRQRDPAIHDMRNSLLELLNNYKIHDTEIQIIYEHPSSYICKAGRVSKILGGFRVLVAEPMMGYQVLGVLHTNFKAVPLKIRDFISNPRWNGYQALQTEIDLFGELVWIEITSREMHGLNQHGIMAHWKGSHAALAEYYQNYLQQLEDLTGDSDIRMNDVLQFASTEQIHVYTPKGDMLTFPKDVTVLDFAYYIHTDLGNTCAGAIINPTPFARVNQATPKRVSIDRKLLNGEQIQIVKDPTIRPSRAWLEQVFTPRAKMQIKRAINAEKMGRAKMLGQELVSQDLKLFGVDYDEFFTSEEFTNALRIEHLSLEKLLIDVGLRKRKIRDFLKNHELVSQQKLERRERMERLFLFKTQGMLMIRDLDDILFQFAACCSPVPGDKIIGFVTEQQEVEIHRNVCPDLKAIAQEALIAVGWDLPEDYVCAFKLLLLTKDAPGTLYRITKVINDAGISIFDSASYGVDRGNAEILISLEPALWRTSYKIIERLRNMKGVQKVSGGKINYATMA